MPPNDNEAMKAFLTEPPGGWDASRLTDVPTTAGQANQVLVGMRAVGLNPADAFQIEGRYPGGPKPPFIVGRDGAGVVIQGDQAGRWRAGDAVVVIQSATTDLRNGTLCEQQWIAADNLAPLPDGWSFVEGSAGPLVYLTAWKALTGPAPLSSGQVVLVTGASGGVGLAAIHLASAFGATVVALSRSESKRRRLQEHGAHFAFDPNDPQLNDRVFTAIGKKGVDVVVENVGGASLTQAVRLLGVHGRIGVVGVLAGVEAVLPIPSFMFKRASMHGILVSDNDPAASQAAWSQIVERLAGTNRRPVIDKVFPFAQTREAFDHLRGDVFGKVVVEIAPSR
jgi:NADPH:quinone reductase-like Zn-dependent oxidoreductase